MSEAEATELLTRRYTEIMAERGVRAAISSTSAEVVKKIARWLTGNIENRRRGLLLYGDKGLGKTTLCYAIVRLVELCKASVAEFCRRNRSKLTPADEQEEWLWLRTQTPVMVTAKELTQASEKRLEELSREGVLIIDDIGVEPVEVNIFGTQTTPIIDIINKRYAKQRCTIITTNLDEDGIAARYGDRTEDRLREMCDKIAFSGESYRR